MEITVQMIFEGQAVTGRFTITKETATREEVRQFAIDFCNENETRFVGVL